MSAFEAEVDVLVMGGGACGAVAALAARAAGATPLLLERDGQPSGSTGMSQGLVCAAGTAAQRGLGIDDGPDLFFHDIMEKTRSLGDPLTARTIADHSGPAVDWLVERHDLPWTLDDKFGAVFGHSRPRVHGWQGHSGSDLIQLLHARLGDLGVDLLTEARLVRIIADNGGKVIGAEFQRPDGRVEAVGCGALIIASGGFSANPDLVRRHMPNIAAARHHGHEGNEGDGLMLGAGLGGALADMGSYQGYAMLTEPHGISVPPNFVSEGAILVNQSGGRFVDETADIAGMVHPVLNQPGGRCWLLFDEGVAGRCSHIAEARLLEEMKAARLGHDVGGIAGTIGVDAARLAKTLAQARAAWSAGQKDPVGRCWGATRPPSGSYRAFKVTGALYHTQGGLQVDKEARVLRPDGVPVANLFAGGGAARSVSGPSSWGYLPAMGLCTAVTLGWLAGRYAAALTTSLEG